MSLELLCQPMHQQLSVLLKGGVSAEELTRDYLNRISHYDTKLNAFMTVFYDSALQAAKIADQKRLSGEPLGALHGIPSDSRTLLKLKDNRRPGVLMRSRIELQTRLQRWQSALLIRERLFLGKLSRSNLRSVAGAQTNFLELLGIHGI